MAAGGSRRRTILAAWILAAIALLPFSRRVHRHTAAAMPVAGTQSADVDRTLRERFSSPFHRPVFLVMGGLVNDADSDAGRAEVRGIVTPLLASKAVVAVISPASSLDTLLIGTDKRTAVAIVGLGPAVEGAMDSVRAITTGSIDALRKVSPALTLRWTGEPALVGDLRAFGAREARNAELRALPVSLMVAVFAFGSLTAAMVAVGIAAIAIIVALGVTGLFAGLLAPSTFTPTLIPLVGLALTLDYVLLFAWRSREGVPERSTQRLIALAAGVVAIGFSGLAIAPTGELRAAAVAGVVVSIVAACTAITLAPLFPALSARKPRPSVAWRRWGENVVRRPVIVAVVCAVPLIVLADVARRARFATTLEALLPAGMESGDALHELQRAGRGGIASSLQIVVELPPAIGALTPEGWTAYSKATASLSRVPGVADARSLTTIGNRDLFGAQNILPGLVVDTYLSRDRHAALVTVVPAETRRGADVTALVQRIRDADASAMSGLPGSKFTVAGIPAFALDYESALQRALPSIITAISVATFLAMLIAFRAPIVALKTVVLNLMVAAAAIGATTLIFDGFAIFPTVPILAFGAAFGTSMDYELFLLGGVRDAHRSGMDRRDGIVHGVANTAGLITRAAAVMACLFFAFSISDLAPLAMVGTTLAIAVLLDATIVRLALAPALLTIGGRWNWWPGRVDSAGPPVRPGD